MNDILSRRFAPGYMIDLRRDDCGCTYAMRVRRTTAGTVTFDPRTFRVDREYEADPVLLGATTYMTPEPLPHRELPPLIRTHAVEAADLEEWLRELMIEHFSQSLGEDACRNESLMASNRALAWARAGELLEAILQPHGSELSLDPQLLDYFWT